MNVAYPKGKQKQVTNPMVKADRIYGKRGCFNRGIIICIFDLNNQYATAHEAIVTTQSTVKGSLFLRFFFIFIFDFLSLYLHQLVVTKLLWGHWPCT